MRCSEAGHGQSEWTQAVISGDGERDPTERESATIEETGYAAVDRGRIEQLQAPQRP